MFIQLGDEFVQRDEILRIRIEEDGYRVYPVGYKDDEGFKILADNLLSATELLAKLSSYWVEDENMEQQARFILAEELKNKGKFVEEEPKPEEVPDPVVIEAEKDATRALEEHCTQEGVDASSMVGRVFDGEKILPAEEVPEQTYEESDVRKAVRNLAKARGKEAAKEMLKEYGATKITEVKEEYYIFIIQACEKRIVGSTVRGG